VALKKKRTEEDVLLERKRRSKFGMRSSGEVPETRTVRMPSRGQDEASCGTCYAQPKEPCISMGTGKPLRYSKKLGSRPRVHASRRAPSVSVPKFEAGSNKLTAAGKEVEDWLGNPFGYHYGGVDAGNPLDVWRYDPPTTNLLPEGGAFVTFLGSPHSVEGAFKKLQPGHTYFAQSAAHTRSGYDEHGQYMVGFMTEHGLVNLMPYEYTILDPLHLWHLVEEKQLKFTPKNLSETDFGWQFFYCQSRGIPKAQALVMCLGSIRKDVGWFEPTEAMGEAWWRMQAVGLPAHVREALLAQVELVPREGERTEMGA